MECLYTLMKLKAKVETGWTWGGSGSLCGGRNHQHPSSQDGFRAEVLAEYHFQNFMPGS